MASSKRVTIRSIAAAVGVAPSTVSKALRDDPLISIERRREIRQMARKLGYRPDPLVSALMSQIHGGRRRQDPEHLAWIDLWPEPRRAARVPMFLPLQEATWRRAEALGYGLAVYRIGQDFSSAAGLRRILRTRSQFGLIIPPVPEEAGSFPLDMTGLAGVTVGTSLRAPTMHRVSPHHFQGAQLACHRLRERGHRRIGLVLSREMHERVEQKWLGGYLTSQWAWPENDRIPPHLAMRADATGLGPWCRQHRPDAVLVADEAWAEALENLSPTLPGHPVKLAWLALPGERTPFPGIDYQPERLGAVAAELVIGQIHRHETGGPATPATLLIDGVWREPAAGPASAMT